MFKPDGGVRVHRINLRYRQPTWTCADQADWTGM